MNKEIWKDIIGYEGFYQISNLGRVKSLNRQYNKKHWQDGSDYIVIRKGKILKPNISKRGYYTVGLSKNGKINTRTVHLMIAKHFIPNPENKKEVNHIDANKLNNDITNLEWCTHKENMVHAQLKNLFFTRPIDQFTLDDVYIRSWDSAKQVENTLGYCYKNINACCRGLRNKASGYKWKYKIK